MTEVVEISHAETEERHRWSEGDVVMWDNSVVLPKADHSDVVGDRVMHRGMVAAMPAHRS